MDNNKATTESNLKNSFFYKFSNFFISRWRVTIILLIGIFLAGTVGLLSNQRQAFPPIPINFVIVNAVYPGASAETVEKQVVIPAETAINEIDDVTKINSTVSDNFASLSIEMAVFETDQINDRASQISDALDKAGIPNEVEFNTFVPSATGPTMFLAVVGDDSCKDLIKCASDIKERLEKSSTEIAKIDLVPSDKFEVKVEIDPEKMNQKGLNYNQVREALVAFSTTLPGGQIDIADVTKSINIQSSISSLDNLKQVQLGQNTKLEDIATIKRVATDLEKTISIAGYIAEDGNPVVEKTVYLAVTGNAKGDSINISNAVQEEIKNLKETGVISQDFEIKILFDAAETVTSQIDDLVSNALSGLVLILVVLLFFINFRAAVVVSFILPLAFLSTFAIFSFIGFSINILTLFAMILALGILVDNAIVVTEGMVFELEEGKSNVQAALNTVAKLGSAITSATLTTLVVFVPFALIPGIIGEFLKFIPYTIIIMMVTSYLLAISITPFFGRYILSNHQTNINQMPNWQKFLIIPLLAKLGQNLIDRLANFYKFLMAAIFKSRITKGVILGVSILIIVGGFFAARFLEFNTFPQTDGNRLTIVSKFPIGTDIETKENILTQATKIVASKDDFISSFVSDESITAIFEDPAKREATIFEIVDELNQDFIEVENQNKGVELTAKVVSNGPPTDEFDIVYQFKTEDITKSAQLLTNLEGFVANLENVEKFENRYKESLVESININFDESKLAEFNINPLIVSGLIRTNFATDNVGRVVVEKSGIADDLIVSLDNSSINSLESLRNLQILPNIQLKDIATVEILNTSQSINRTDGERILEFAVKVKENEKLNKNEIVDRVNQSVFGYLGFEKLENKGFFGLFKADYDKFDTTVLKDDALAKEFGIESANQINLAGANAEQAEDFGNLGLVLILAFLAVYVILVNQFNSYIKPVLILFTVIFAFAGVFPGLLIFSEAVSFISGLGVLSLIGIAVNDAIVFIDALQKNQEKEHLETLPEVLTETGFQRFKPILSTTITTVLGVLPLTVTDPFWRGLGIAIIAGLIFSTFATLFLVPLIYDTVAETWNKFFPKYKSKNIEEK